MKIDNVINSLSGVRAKDGRDLRSRKRDDTQSPDSVRDNVDLSSASSRLQALESALAEVDVTDIGKIDSIRDAIASGQFKVDEEVVAEKIVESTVEQLSHHRK